MVLFLDHTCPHQPDPPWGIHPSPRVWSFYPNPLPHEFNPWTPKWFWWVMELWDGTWFAYWWPWESMWLASILSWLRNQRWASFSYPWMIWATAARSSWMSWSATPSHGNNSMLDAAEMNVVSCFIQCSMYKRQIRLVQQHRPRLVCWKSRRQEEDRLWCASLMDKHLDPGELLTLCREGTTQTLSTQGCDLLCQLQQHRWGRREVTAKSSREKVVGFCYSQHWSECATFECW